MDHPVFVFQAEDEVTDGDNRHSEIEKDEDIEDIESGHSLSPVEDLLIKVFQKMILRTEQVRLKIV